jgi:phosphohistidine phosphatase
MELYLVRHAIAEARDAEQWPDDGLRPLTADGEAKFRKAARGLHRLVPTVDAVVASPFTRAWRTAELLQKEPGWPVPEVARELEAGRPPQAAIDAIRRHAAAGSLALVGHEPNLSELASILLTGSPTRAQLEMKKGGAACLELDALDRGSAWLRWLLTPKALRSLAP